VEKFPNFCCWLLNACYLSVILLLPPSCSAHLTGKIMPISHFQDALAFWDEMPTIYFKVTNFRDETADYRDEQIWRHS
jgi:hypothetical protein